MKVRMNYAYEIVATGFLFIITICSHKKNWLSLHRNRVFQQMLYAALILSILDIVLHWYNEQGRLATSSYLGIVMALGILIMQVLVFLYILILSERVSSAYKKALRRLLVPSFLAIVAVILTPYTHFVFSMREDGSIQYGVGIIFLVVIYLGYWVGTIFLAFTASKHVRGHQGMGMFFLLFLPLVSVIFQYSVLDGKLRLYVYSVAIVLIYCYVFFQNMDRYSDRSSGGFSRSGFRAVVRDRWLYQEDFACLSINIQNHQNIKAICDSEEISRVQQQIGNILRKQGGRHNQFHIHGSEFIVMQKTAEDAVRLYQTISTLLPKTMRNDNRKIVIHYGFYLLTMKESSYNQEDFYRILSGMRKLLKNHTNKWTLMRYEGGVKDYMDRELLIGKKLRRILSERKCESRFHQIRSLKPERMVGIEALLYMTDSEGEVISLEEILDVAGELGCIRAIGLIFYEQVLDFVSREHLIEAGLEKIHINMKPIQITSQSLICKYRELAKQYQIPIERICIEITEDASVSSETLAKYVRLLKDTGISLLLDQYGVNFCNLQQIMNMPFDVVKINNSLTYEYSVGESKVLEYQVKMLRGAGFQIAVDGVDSQKTLEQIRPFEPEYIQGYFYGKPMSAGKILSIFYSEQFESSKKGW